MRVAHFVVYLFLVWALFHCAMFAIAVFTQ